MKKLLFILIAVCGMAVSVAAQESHLTFKNIPIDGNVNEFVTKLEAEGFTKKSQTDNIVMMKGKFVGKDCEIGVIATPKSKKVWKVAVFLPEKDGWYSLKSDYKELKAQFTTKYGNAKSYEFFSNPYYEGDGYEMTALRVGKCNYFSAWETSEGSITIEIGKTKQICICYEDAINLSIKQKEEKQAVANDI